MRHLLIGSCRDRPHEMELLTDGDRAQNDAGWQWSRGRGGDAHPRFRAFTPVIAVAKAHCRRRPRRP